MFRAVLLSILTALLASSASAAVTRHQLRKETTPEIGFRYYGGVYEDGAGGVPSDGIALWMLDKSSLVGTFGGTWALDNTVSFLFRGTGLDIVYVSHPEGEQLAWQIVDSGTDGAFNVVASGTLDTFAASSALVAAPVAAPGSLNRDRLYMLRLTIQDSDSSTVRRLAFIDAFDVHDEQPTVTTDDGASSWTLTGWNAPGLAESNSIDGGRSASNAAGSTMEITFDGPSIAVIGFQQATVGGTYTWTIDNGAGPSGTVDTSLDRDYRIRFAELIINDLSLAPHTLTITASGNGNAGAFPPHSAYAQIDAVMHIESETTPVTLSEFAID
jgi:hypothetical protein